MQKNPTQHKNDKKKSRAFSLFKPRDRQPNYILSVLCTTVALLLVVVLDCHGTFLSTSSLISKHYLF